LQAMRDKELGFLAFGLQQSKAHAAYFRSRPLSALQKKEFADLAEKSLAEQAELEREEADSFDAFIASYGAYTVNGFSV